MAAGIRMSRSRGTLSGLALILLGAWGGLAPMIGPYFGFGFEPNQPWHYTMGRLILTMIPGGVAVLAGLVILVTRSRGFGAFCALIAAAAGAWFAIGTALLLAAGATGPNVTVGQPIATTPARIVLTNLGSLSGVGLLIVFFAALAMGRMSIGAYKDFLRFGDPADSAAGGLANVGLASSNPPFDSYQPTQYQPTQYQPDLGGGQSYDPVAAEQPVVGGQAQFPSQYPVNQDTIGQGPPFPTAQSGYPGAADPFGESPGSYTPGGPVTYSPGQTQYPPTQSQTDPLAGPTQEQQFPPAQR